MILLTILDPKTVRLPDGAVVRHRTPILEACRRLIADGADPKTRFEAWWHGASHPALLGTVGGAAKLTVHENDRHGPRLAPYSPNPHRFLPRQPPESRENGAPATPLAAKP